MLVKQTIQNFTKNCPAAAELLHVGGRTERLADRRDKANRRCFQLRKRS